jgi:hypothetical protein
MSEAAPSIPPGTPPAPKLRLIKNNEVVEKPVEMPSSVDGVDTSNTESWDKRESGLVVPPGSMDTLKNDQQSAEQSANNQVQKPAVSADYGEFLAPGSQQTREDQLMREPDEASSLNKNNDNVREARQNDSSYANNASEWIQKQKDSQTDVDIDKVREARSSDKAYAENASEWIQNNKEANTTQGKIEEGQRKIGEAVNKRIEELVNSGMSEQDATDQATDEFLGRIKPENKDGDKGPKELSEEDIEGVPFFVEDKSEKDVEDKEDEEPPDDDNNEQDKEDKDDSEEKGKAEEPSDIERRAAEADAELQEAMAYLDTRVENFARARIALERILGGKNQEIFDAAERDLHDAFAKLEAARAKCVGIQMEQFDAAASEIQRQGDVIAESMQKAQEALDNAKPEDDIDLLRKNVQAYEAWQRENEDKKQLLEQQRQEVLAQNQEANLQLLTQVQQRVDAEMIAQREAKHPKLAKFNEWMKKHPVARIAAGAALAGAGILGVATGNIPLVVAATAGRAALAGYGGYNIVRGLGENRATTQFGKADIGNIQDYTEAAETQSTTRRRSKKGGAVLGAALASIPIIKGVQSIANMHPPVTPTGTNVVEPPHVAEPPPLTPDFPADSHVPWDHFAHTLKMGPEGATNKIYELVAKAPRLGWTVNHVGTGRAFSIPSIIAPDGRVISDPVGINRALDLLNAAVNQQGI